MVCYFGGLLLLLHAAAGVRGVILKSSGERGARGRVLFQHLAEGGCGALRRLERAGCVRVESLSSAAALHSSPLSCESDFASTTLAARMPSVLQTASVPTHYAVGIDENSEA